MQYYPTYYASVKNFSTEIPFGPVARNSGDPLRRNCKNKHFFKIGIPHNLYPQFLPSSL